MTKSREKILTTAGVRRGRASRAPPFDVAVTAVVPVSAVCEQVDEGDQVVPTHQVDDINEVHELDPVHQVNHKDECTSPHITSHPITSHHIIILYHNISYHIMT